MKYFVNLAKVTSEDIHKKSEKIKKCILSCKTVPQMQSCWNMIENFYFVYAKGEAKKEVVDTVKSLHLFMNKIIRTKWQYILESQG